MAEQFVAVSPDSTGKKIRNEQIDAAQPDGTTQTVQTQVVRLAEYDRRLLESLNLTMKRQLAALVLILQAFNNGTPDGLSDIDNLAKNL